MHWNLGSRFWERKREDIQHLVDQFSPDFLFVSEANLFPDTPEHLVDIEGYTLTKVKTMDTLKFSRNSSTEYGRNQLFCRMGQHG